MNHYNLLDWSTARWEERCGKLSFVVNIICEGKSTFMTTSLAQIKKKNDGRYQWWKKKGTFIITERKGKLEGVCSTLEDAKLVCLEDIEQERMIL